MPDAAAAERFIARVSRLERRYVAAVSEMWRSARPALLDALSRGQNVQPAIATVGRDLARVGRTTTPQLVQLALGFAEEQAERDAGALPLMVEEAALAPLQAGLPAWQAVTVGRFLADQQRLEAAGVEPAQIAVQLLALATISGAPLSAYQWALGALQLAAEGALWSAANGTLRAAYRQLEAEGEVYQKQAIAAIDGRTTRCCLAVHGQIRELDEPFTLTGTPRYASQMQQPPFHYRCRTVIVLHSPAMEAVGPPTPALRAAARAELARR